MCRCHGLTASCTMKVCWNNMPLFSDVSKRLTKKYKSAIRVSLDRNENELVPKQHRRKRKRKMRRNIRSARKRTGHKRYINRPRLRNRISSESVSNKHARRKLTDESLVYTHRSPKFCSTSPSKGSFGTRGRLCDPLISAGWGSCKYMCCKRGFKASNLVERKPCRCRLRGCCTLDCDECTESKTVYHCLWRRKNLVAKIVLVWERHKLPTPEWKDCFEVVSIRRKAIKHLRPFSVFAYFTINSKRLSRKRCGW